MARVIFLDRDGVINKYPGDGRYVTSLKGFRLLRGSASAIRDLTKKGYKIFVISNQAGVSKGLYSKKALDAMTRFMQQEIERKGGRIQKTFYCLHTKDRNCSCRKPKIGLLKAATRDLKVDLKDSYFIGDSLLDMKAGRAFGCKTILVLSGREKLANIGQWDESPDFIAPTLSAAAKNILAGRYERA